MSEKVISQAWQIRSNEQVSGWQSTHDRRSSWLYEVAVMPFVKHEKEIERHNDGYRSAWHERESEGAWITMPQPFAERMSEHIHDGRLMLLADPETLRMIATCLQKVADINESSRKEWEEEQAKMEEENTTTKEVSDGEAKK